MALIFKFPTNRKLYSDKFIKDIKPNAIGDFIRIQHPGLSARAADAMALAIIYSTYLQLVFEEEGEEVPVDVIRKFEENDQDTFIWSHGKKTVH
jgi:hypothetical protein